jgi:hypothetical protein
MAPSYFARCFLRITLIRQCGRSKTSPSRRCEAPLAEAMAMTRSRLAFQRRPVDFGLGDGLSGDSSGQHRGPVGGVVRGRRPPFEHRGPYRTDGQPRDGPPVARLELFRGTVSGHRSGTIDGLEPGIISSRPQRVASTGLPDTLSTPPGATRPNGTGGGARSQIRTL